MAPPSSFEVALIKPSPRVALISPSQPPSTRPTLINPPLPSYRKWKCLYLKPTSKLMNLLCNLASLGIYMGTPLYELWVALIKGRSNKPQPLTLTLTMHSVEAAFSELASRLLAKIRDYGDKRTRLVRKRLSGKQKHITYKY